MNLSKRERERRALKKSSKLLSIYIYIIYIMGFMNGVKVKSKITERMVSGLEMVDVKSG